MLKIRLQRVGRKHEPSFRLVLTDSKNSTKSGKYLENLGHYDSRRGEQSEFKGERINYWMSKGAQLSGTVHNVLIDKKIILGKKINVLPLKKAIVKEAPAEVSTPTPAPTAEESSTKVETVSGISAETTPKTEAPIEAPVVPETTSEDTSVV